MVQDASGTKLQSIGTDMFGRPRLSIRRNKLACFVSGIFSVFAVTLVAICLFFLLNLLHIAITGHELDGMGRFPAENSFLTGVTTALFVSMFNVFVCFITVPLVWILLGQSLGRFPHRGFATRLPYFTACLLSGACLVGLASIIPYQHFFTDTYTGSRSLALQTIAGSVLCGLLIGSLAGALTATVHLLILRPATQLGRLYTSTIHVF